MVSSARDLSRAITTVQRSLETIIILGADMCAMLREDGLGSVKDVEPPLHSGCFDTCSSLDEDIDRFRPVESAAK